MAKATIAFSKARGKVGGLVFRHDAGIGTVVSEYNPHPNNPRTAAQTRQRAKMNVVGQISKYTPASVLLGLDPNKRKARSRFVSLALKASDAQDNPPQALLLAEDLVLSVGHTGAITASAANTAGTTKVVVTLTGNTVENGMAGCIVMVYCGDDDRFFGGKGLSVPVNTPSVEFDFADFSSDLSNAPSMNVYVVPIEAVEGAVTINYRELTMADRFTAGWTELQSNREGFCASRYVGRVFYNS